MMMMMMMNSFYISSMCMKIVDEIVVLEHIFREYLKIACKNMYV